MNKENNISNSDSADCIIQDTEGRDIIVINKEGRVAFARFPNQDEAIKDYMISVCRDLTTDDPEALRDFLNYKGEDSEFCV